MENLITFLPAPRLGQQHSVFSSITWPLSGTLNIMKARALPVAGLRFSLIAGLLKRGQSVCWIRWKNHRGLDGGSVTARGGYRTCADTSDINTTLDFWYDFTGAFGNETRKKSTIQTEEYHTNKWDGNGLFKNTAASWSSSLRVTACQVVLIVLGGDYESMEDNSYPSKNLCRFCSPQLNKWSWMKYLFIVKRKQYVSSLTVWIGRGQILYVKDSWGK